MRVRVDPTRCVAFGYCAELCPEHFTLDDWGYAWLTDGDAPAERLALLRETAKRCPTGAILIEVVDAPDTRVPRRHPERSAAKSKDLSGSEPRVSEVGRSFDSAALRSG